MSVEENISILSYVSADRLKEIIRVLRENGVPEDTIKQELKGIVIDGRHGRKVEDIFDDTKVTKNKKEKFRNIKRYIILTGKYGMYYTKDDIEAICAKKHITPQEFIGEMLSSNEDFVNLYYNKIMSGGRLYIGPTKPIDNQFLGENSEEIIELSRIAAKKFAMSTMAYDLDELQSLSLELIVNQCGGLVDNLQENHDALRGAIINRTSKCLYSVAKPKPLSITQTHTSKTGVTFTQDSEIPYDLNESPYESDEQTSLQGAVDYKKAEFNTAEEEVMECMIRLIEEGEADDLYKKIAQSIFMEEAEVLEIMHSIRQKMIQNKLVKQSARGGYEFRKSSEEGPDVETKFCRADVDIDSDQVDL